MIINPVKEGVWQCPQWHPVWHVHVRCTRATTPNQDSPNQAIVLQRPGCITNFGMTGNVLWETTVFMPTSFRGGGGGGRNGCKSFDDMLSAATSVLVRLGCTSAYSCMARFPPVGGDGSEHVRVEGRQHVPAGGNFNSKGFCISRVTQPPTSPTTTKSFHTHARYAPQCSKPTFEPAHGQWHASESLTMFCRTDMSSDTQHAAWFQAKTAEVA
eukprot:365914-Chlamydomonas_euryale.AAC.4